MKKYLIVIVVVLLTETLIATLMPGAFGSPVHRYQPDSLSDYAGRFEASQNGITLQYSLDVNNGKLIATNLSSGQKLHLKRTDSDNFMVEEMGIPIIFIRNANRKITEIQMPDGTVWKKLESSEITINLPGNYQDYLGSYKLDQDGHTLSVEIAVKYGKLWIIDSSENTDSPITYLAGGDFSINATGVPVKFIRDKNKKIIQLIYNGKDFSIKR